MGDESSIEPREAKESFQVFLCRRPLVARYSVCQSGLGPDSLSRKFETEEIDLFASKYTFRKFEQKNQRIGV